MQRVFCVYCCERVKDKVLLRVESGQMSKVDNIMASTNFRRKTHDFESKEHDVGMCTRVWQDKRERRTQALILKSDRNMTERTNTNEKLVSHHMHGSNPKNWLQHEIEIGLARATLTMRSIPKRIGYVIGCRATAVESSFGRANHGC